MKKIVHIADGYDRVFETGPDGTLREVDPIVTITSSGELAKPTEDVAIDDAVREDKTSSNVWI